MAKFVLLFLVMAMVLAAPVPASEVRAVRVEQGPRIDGDLADPVWQAAAAFTAFRMAEPRPGAEPSEKTELRIVYDDGQPLYRRPLPGRRAGADHRPIHGP